MLLYYTLHSDVGDDADQARRTCLPDEVIHRKASRRYKLFPQLTISQTGTGGKKRSMSRTLH